MWMMVMVIKVRIQARSEAAAQPTRRRGPRPLRYPARNGRFSWTLESQSLYFVQYSTVLFLTSNHRIATQNVTNLHL